MTIPQVVDGVTDADAAFMNQLVDAANQANAAFNGAGQITTAAITPALEGYGPVENMRAVAPWSSLEWGIDADDNDHASDFATMLSELAGETNRSVQLRPGVTVVESSIAVDVRGICLIGTGGGRPADQG